MTEEQAMGWLRKKGWHITDLRVEALVAGLDLERDCGRCTSWSDGGPCATCICHAMEKRGTPVEVRPPRGEMN